MKNIIVLGATGSIGDSVLSVIKQNENELSLHGISFGSNITKAEKIINEFKLKNIYSDSTDSSKYLKNNFKDNTELNILSDKYELEEFLNSDSVDIIVSAVSGFAGLATTLIAAKTGKTILLANKESVVVAGEIVLPLAEKHNTQIIPIDSEHNAIFQCLNSDKKTDDVSKIIITASGGPFLNRSISELSKVTKDEALNHPNWVMGAKITIDSASLVNKCLELIEARYLFNLNEKFFDIVVQLFNDFQRVRVGLFEHRQHDRIAVVEADQRRGLFARPLHHRDFTQADHALRGDHRQRCQRSDKATPADTGF